MERQVTAIRFVDAHMHLWDLARIDYPWLMPGSTADGPNGDVTPIARNFGLDDYRAALARWNLAGMVHVEAGAAPQCALDETAWLDALRECGGAPNGIVAFATLDDPNLGAALAAHASHRGVRGVRHIVNWHPDARRTYTDRDLLQDENWARGYALLERHGLSFDLQCYPGQMAAMARVAERHPGVSIIINHMGMPVLTDPTGLADWREGLQTLAMLPHAAVKISGMGFAIRDWTASQIRPLILETIEIFGTERCMFASDLPTDLLFGTVDRYMETYHEAVHDFSDAERQAMFGTNANRIYRLELDL